MEADDLLCSRNARPQKALVGRAQWKITQPPSPGEITSEHGRIMRENGGRLCNPGSGTTRAQYESVMVRPGLVSLWLKEGIGAELIAQWRCANLTPRSQVEA